MEKTNYFLCPFLIKQYELIEKIGFGSFSYVYKSIDITNGKLYAMKIIAKNKLTHDGDLERLQREIDSMALLNHENIVKLYDFFSDNDNYYIIMEYCSGGSLYSYISDGKILKEEQASIIFRQIILGTQYCHARGVVHRDLKPQNILVSNFPKIKISDFGLCAYSIKGEKMSTHCGSPCYSAPECLRDNDYEGKYSDIWSLGVILYELVTSKHPWPIDNLPNMTRCIFSSKYDIPKYVTLSCQHLIKVLLNTLTKERPSFKEILDHPWLKNAKGLILPEGFLSPGKIQTVNEIVKKVRRKRINSGIQSPISLLSGINSPAKSELIKKESRITLKSKNSNQSIFHSAPGLILK